MSIFCQYFPSSLACGRKYSLSVIALSLLMIVSIAESASAAKTETTTTLNVSSSHISRGDSIVLSAAVKSSTGPAINPGLVLFCEASAAHCLDDAVLGSAQLLGDGTASIKVRPSVGKHRIYALFQGTQSYASSRSWLRELHVHGKFETSTLLESLGGSGGKFVMTASVTQAPRGLTKPPLSGVVALNGPGRDAPPRIASLGKPTFGFKTSIQDETLFNYVPSSIVPADFNKDGFTDLAVLGSGSVEVLLGDPAHPGEFLPSNFYAVPNIGSQMTAGDFDGDGVLDLAVSTSGGVQILLGNRASPGQFQLGGSYASPTTVQDINYLAVGDFNNDGLPDLVSIGGRSGIFGLANVLLNDAAHPGEFLPVVSYPVGVRAGHIVVADFNGDGFADIAVACSSNASAPAQGIHDGTVSILIGDGLHPGKFLAAVNYPSGYSTDSIAVGDFNKDGLPDIAVGNLGRQNIGILLNDATHPGQFPTLSLSFLEIDPYQYHSVVVGDFNQDGTLDVAAGSSEYLGLIFGDPDHPGQFEKEVGECCAGVGEGDSLTALVAVNLDSDEAPVLFASQNAGLSAIITQSWHSHGIETATATFGNITAPDVPTVFSRAKYSGAANYLSSESSWTNPNAPTISDITVSNITLNSATISWTSNVKSYGLVSYRAYGASLDMYSQWPSAPSTKHTVVITNLLQGSSYLFQARSVVFFPDGSHWTAISPATSFITSQP